MVFLERVLAEIEKNGITKNKLLVDLKLGKNTFLNWAGRGTVPSGITANKIADYFNVSVDYLLGNTDDPTPPDAKKETPAIISGAEALRIFVESKLGRKATLEELERLEDFAETFIKGLDK